MILSSSNAQCIFERESPFVESLADNDAIDTARTHGFQFPQIFKRRDSAGGSNLETRFSGDKAGLIDIRTGKHAIPLNVSINYSFDSDCRHRASESQGTQLLLFLPTMRNDLTVAGVDSYC